MAVTAQRITVNDEPEKLDQPAAERTGAHEQILIRNRGSIPIHLGPADVTSSTGFQLDPGDAISLQLGRGRTDGGPSFERTDEGIYAITASGTAVCHVLQAGI